MGCERIKEKSETHISLDVSPEGTYTSVGINFNITSQESIDLHKRSMAGLKKALHVKDALRRSRPAFADLSVGVS